MSEISQELAAQMAALVRDLHADHLLHSLEDRQQDFCKRTAAIVTELSKLIDPLLIEAREIVKVIIRAERGIHCSTMDKIDAGEWDNLATVRSTLAGLKRGHALGVIEAAARGKA